jgi:photosystem II stability/assembly factor-like uncharacterized protein
VGIPAPRATLGSTTDVRDGAVTVLRFADEQNGWAGVNELYATHDGGAHWHRIALPGLGENSAVSAVATGGGYAFVTVSNCASEGGQNCRSSAEVWASPIASDSWRRITPALAKSSSGLVVHGADWFVPGTGHIYHGHGASYTGSAPNPCPSSSDGTPTPVLAIADSRHLDAVCLDNGGAGSAEYQLYGTTDGGAHWAKAGPKHVEPSGLFFAADNGAGVLLLATASGGSQLLRTTDDGTTFTNATVGAPTGGYEWSDLGFTTTSQAFAVWHQRRMYISRDNGKTFTRVTFR